MICQAGQKPPAVAAQAFALEKYVFPYPASIVFAYQSDYSLFWLVYISFACPKGRSYKFDGNTVASGLRLPLALLLERFQTFDLAAPLSPPALIIDHVF
jgi:hypothetical protein